MDENNNVQVADATTVEQTTDSQSQDFETNTTEANVNTGENQPNTTEVEGGEVEQTAEQIKSQYVPYDRFHSKIEEVNTLRARTEALQAQLEALQSNPEVQGLLSKQQNPLYQENPDLEVADSTLAKMGYVKSETVGQLVSQEVIKVLQAERQRESLTQKVESLEKRYDGKNGLPKFDLKSVVEYGLKTEIYDPEKAYESMHLDAIINQRAKQAKGTPYTERGRSSGIVGNDNDALMGEAKKTGDFTKVISSRISNPYGQNVL
jgi:hypothetical protein